MTSQNIRNIPLANPTFDEEMKKAALNALQNEHFVLGEDVYKFEEEFAKYCGTKYAISTSSGTSALHLSLIALGIARRDQVITSAFSFIATANVIHYVGANPIFADIDTKTCNIDPDEIRKTITKHTKAIIPVHLYGYPCDMEQITKIAENHGAKVLEDACQAHGAECNRLKVGAIGDVGCFSFYPTKNMTVCGDGGMVVTNDGKIAETVSKLRDCGRKTRYEHDLIGYTARLNTVNAAIGRVQLKRLDAWNEKRRRNAALYDKSLSDLNDVTLPPSGDSHFKPVYHLYVIRVKKRAKLKKWLESNGIQTGINYPLPIHLQPIYKELFKYESGMFPVSEVASQTCLSIPMYPSLKSDEVEFVSKKIHEFFQ